MAPKNSARFGYPDNVQFDYYPAPFFPGGGDYHRFCALSRRPVIAMLDIEIAENNLRREFDERVIAGVTFNGDPMKLRVAPAANGPLAWFRRGGKDDLHPSPRRWLPHRKKPRHEAGVKSGTNVRLLIREETMRKPIVFTMVVTAS